MSESSVGASQERPEVTKAVIAAAGFGTRFLPATKTLAKEMLPILDKPVIQLIVEELVEAGITDVVVVTSPHKHTIQEHLDEAPSTELTENLRLGGKTELLAQLERIHSKANFIFVNQSTKFAYGNAAPLLTAEKLIGDQPFIYSYADDFVEAKPSRFNQLVDVYHERGGSVLTCLRRDNPADYTRYGYVAGQSVTDTLVSVETIIEKPGSREAAPSDLASVSGYLFQPELFGYLKDQHRNLPSGTEFAVQTSLQTMIDDGHLVYGLEVNGEFRDAGSPLELLKTNIAAALNRADMRQELITFMEGEIAKR